MKQKFTDLMHNRMFMLSLMGVLGIVVCAQIINVNLAVSRIHEIRAQQVPQAKATYTDVHELLALIKKGRIDASQYALAKGTSPTRSQFYELAKVAGIATTPTVTDRREQRSRNKLMKEMQLDITVQNVSGDSVFTFLNSIDNISASGRIKELSLSRYSRDRDKFNLSLKYSTYSSKSGQ